MRFVLPAILFALFAAMIVVSPHVDPRRLRARAAAVGEQLRMRHGFTTGSKAAWQRTVASGLPPFNYGARRELDGEQAGEIDGLPVRVAGYECVINGARHRYGLACVIPPHPVPELEARGEPVYSSAVVADHVPDGARAGATPDFDRAYQLFAVEPDAAALATGRVLAVAMMQAPEPFSWRAAGGEVLLWRRGGWTSADSLTASVRIVLDVLSLARTVQPV
jgi:hypothetical protein